MTAMCDNLVVAYVNKQGGTVSRALCLLTSRLLRWTESFDIHLDARYLPSENNILADVLGRRGQVVGIEWSLHPQVARSLLRTWGNPSIDLFATCLNTKLPLYCSLVPDPQAVFQDAFCHPWDDLDLYAFPPFYSGRSGDRPCSRVVACRDDSGRASLAREGLVHRLAASADPTSCHPALVGQSATEAPLQSLPPRRPGVEPSRMVTQASLPKVGLFGKGCSSLGRVPPAVFLSIIPVEMADLLWLVSWKGRCSSQRHCSSSRGLSDPLTPGQGLVRLCG